MNIEQIDLLCAEYAAAMEETKLPRKEANQAFFRYMRNTFDDFASQSDNSMRGILVSRKAYVPHNPRSPSKKDGRNKESFIQEMEELVGVSLPSASKMTIVDIQAIITRLRS